MFRRRSLAFLVFFSMVATVLPFAQPAAAISADIVISQVYGGGGNSGATLKNDFIELFNRGASPVNVSGWSVQYASTAGTTWQKTALASITLQPGQLHRLARTSNAPVAVPPGPTARTLYRPGGAVSPKAAEYVPYLSVTPAYFTS